MSAAALEIKAKNLYEAISHDIDSATLRFENPDWGFESVGIFEHTGSTDAVLTLGTDEYSHLGFVSVGLRGSSHSAADEAIEQRASDYSVKVGRVRHFAGTLLLGNEVGPVFSVQYVERACDFVSSYCSSLRREMIIPQADSVIANQGISFRGLLSFSEYFVYDRSGLSIYEVPKGAKIRNGYIHGEAVSPTEIMRQKLLYDTYAFKYDLTGKEREIFESMAEEYFHGGKPCNYDKLCKGIMAAKRP